MHFKKHVKNILKSMFFVTLLNPPTGYEGIGDGNAKRVRSVEIVVPHVNVAIIRVNKKLYFFHSYFLEDVSNLAEFYEKCD